MVGKHNALLDYLMKKDIMHYRAIVKELGLRKWNPFKGTYVSPLFFNSNVEIWNKKKLP